MITEERVHEIVRESLRDWFKKGKQFVRNTKPAKYRKGTYKKKS